MTETTITTLRGTPVPVSYWPLFLGERADGYFKALRDELAWVRIGSTPRSEYYVNDVPRPYTYGSGRGVRTYAPQPMHPAIHEIRSVLGLIAPGRYEVCFLNRYLDQRDQLGWHADDSPEMDDAHPIAIVSLGALRDIHFAPNADLTDRAVLRLGHGSLAVMAPGMQDTHKHRIPKAGFIAGERISLTFRGYVGGTP